MGRQAYMTRLALGRSPYEPPEYPEAFENLRNPGNDNFDGYHQQYNDRGHPVNPESRTEARELRRAKNDILSTVGVVVSKDDDKKLKYQKKNDKQKIDAVVSENEYGLALAALDLGLMFATLWWLVSLRARIQVFKSYSHVPLMEMIRTEIRHIGPWAFFCAGVPAWTVSHIINTWRNYIMEPTVEWVLEKVHPRTNEKGSHKNFQIMVDRYSDISSTVLFLFSYPLQAFSLLQSLHLIPATSTPNLASMVPFTQSSPLAFPWFTGGLSSRSLSRGFFEVLTHPFLLGFMNDYLRHHIESKLYRNLRRRAVKADNPDSLSIHAALEDELDDSTIPGLGSMRRRNRGHPLPSLTLLEEIKYELNKMQQRLFSFVGLQPLANTYLWPNDWAFQQRVNELQSNYMADHNLAHESSILARRVEIRAMAIRQAHSERGTSPPPYLETELEIQEAENEPSTPQIADLFNVDQVLTDSPTERQIDLREEAEGSSTQPAANSSTQDQEVSDDFLVQVPSRANTLVEPSNTSPEPTPPNSPHVRASLIHQDSENVTMQLEVLQSNRSARLHQTSTLPPQPAVVPEVYGPGTGANANLWDELMDGVAAMHGGLNEEHDGTWERPPSTPTIQNPAPGSNVLGRPLPRLSDQSAVIAASDPAPPNPSNLNPSIPQHHGSLAFDHFSPIVTPIESLTPIHRSEVADDVNDLAAPAPSVPFTPTRRSAQAADPSPMSGDDRLAFNTVEDPVMPDGPVLPPLEPNSDGHPTITQSPAPITAAEIASGPPGSRRNRSQELNTPRVSPSLHRVTALSNHPSDAMASHVSSLIASLVLLPLEAIYLRSLARSCLADSPNRPAIIGLRSDIRGLGAMFGGEGSIWNRLRYASTMALLVGLQGVISSAVWGMGTSVAIWIGRRSFGWGRL